MPKQNLVNINH